MPKIVLGLGSNVGERAANLQSAIDGIKTLATNLKLSTVLESAALLPEGAPADWDMAFYNMAVMGDVTCTPAELLKMLKQLEVAVGRKDRGNWAPREIDVDILAYGEEIHALPGLSIPHPQLLARDFALLPLAELWPGWRYPVSGDYKGWKSIDIALDKKYGLNSNLKQSDVRLYG